MKRWIIRSLFIGLLLLCVGGWGWSLTHWGRIKYVRAGLGVQFYTGHGGVDIGGGRDTPDGWECEWYPSVPICVLPPEDPKADLSLIGFQFYRASYTGTLWYTLEMPYWFLTVISVPLLWLVWRKTRPKVKGRAFPVEVKRPGG